MRRRAVAARVALLAAAMAACGGGEPSVTRDAGDGPDARPAPADARPSPDGGPLPALPDLGAAGACAAVAGGPQAAVPLADRATTELSLSLPAVGDGRVSAVEVAIQIQHPYPRDLTVTLVSPSGKAVTLTGHRGTGPGYLATRFADDAATAIDDGDGAYLGRFRPDEPLAALAGEPVAGAWRLRVTDAAAGDTGTLWGWALRVSACPPPACVTTRLHLEPPTPSTPHDRERFIPVPLDAYFTVVAARVGVSIISWIDEDLSLGLWSPAGIPVDLTSGNGGLGSDYRETVFDDTAAVAITAGRAPFTGSFRPETPLARVAGGPAGGTWLLTLGPELLAGYLESAYLELDVCELACPFGAEPHRYPLSPAGTALVAEGGRVAAVALRFTAAQASGPLRLWLRAPSSSTLALSPSGGAVFADTLFVDAAGRELAGGTPPFAGAFRPAQALSALHDEVAAGTWRLEARAGDDVPAVTAELYLCVSP